ncbi:MAG: DUF2461 domain-containing protein [Marmoricola sp.]
MSDFQGFPTAALDFYDDLEMDNTRAFWEAHRETYDESVRAPMIALTDALAKEFGTAKIFRPYRDVRFAKDKTPYKTAQGAIIQVAPATGWYVQISAPGVRTSGGFYHAEAADIARIRDGIHDDRTGAELDKMLTSLQRKGFELTGEKLKTSPRGYDADHPRIDLLRHKTMTLSRSYGFEPVIHTPDLLDRIRKDWRTLRPFLDWLTQRLV